MYYHGDQIGSSRLMTSDGGWPVWQGTFLPYGEEYNPEITTNHYKFTGKERDSESGLDYFGARYYSNGLGRFITPDWSAVPVPVPYADLTDPQSLNQYTYVRNLPLNRVDLDGHDAWNKFIGVLKELGNEALPPAGVQPFSASDAEQQNAMNVTSAATLLIPGVGEESAVEKVGMKVEQVIAKEGTELGEKIAVKIEEKIAAKIEQKVETGIGEKVGTAGGERAGKAFTPAGKAEVKAENAANHGGQTTCEGCGQPTVPAQQSKSGITPPGNETHVDHIIPKSKGGDGSPSNGQVLCGTCNLDKSNH